MNAVIDRRVSLPDGSSIAARFFEPRAHIRASVLIVPAMGVTQSFYEPLARWLTEQGLLAASFDYRGMGRSRDGPLAKTRVDILDWARGDCAGMLDALREAAPDVPLVWIGHSLGGQIVPFVPNQRLIDKIVTIATGSGYWRENSPKLRRTVWWLWYVAAPLSVRLFGYFPGRRLRKVGDLPRGVLEQWRRWCLHPEYAVGVEGDAARRAFAAVSVPITSFSFTDDEYMSARNTESMHGFYTGAPRNMKRFAPSDIGVQRIGHFGFFRSENEAALWRAYLLPELQSA